MHNIQITDQKILLDDLPVYFLTLNDKYFSRDCVQIETSDCGVQFKIKTHEQCLMVVPAKNKKIIIGNNYDCINTKFIQKFTDTLPVFHLIDEECISISVNGETIITCFKKHFEQYMSISCNPQDNEVKFYLDTAKNYRTNLQRFNQKFSLSYSGALENSVIEKCLFYGYEMKKEIKNFDDLFSSVFQIQKTLNSHNIDSVIIGSAAERLNGIYTQVEDIDLMVKNATDMKFASITLEENGFIKDLQNDKQISLHNDLIKIDITWDNYNVLNNPFNITCSQGLKFFNSQGLMWLCLMNECENIFTRNIYEKNKFAIYRLNNFNSMYNLPNNSKLQKLWIHDAMKTNNCQKLCNIINTMSVNFDDITINEPFKVNSFSLNQDCAYSILKLGHESTIRIVTPFLHKTAFWIGITGEILPVKMDIRSDFSFLFVDNVLNHGVIFATNEEVEFDHFRQKYKI